MPHLKGNAKLDTEKLRRDANVIFQAGLDAVDPVRAIKNFVRLEGEILHVTTEQSY